MRHHTTPCEYLLPAWGLPANSKENKHFSHLSRWPYSAFAFLSAFLPTFPKAARSHNYRAFLHSQCFPERTNQTPKAEAICPDPQRISEATPGNYLNKGSIVSMASSTIFNNKMGRRRNWVRARSPNSLFLNLGDKTRWWSPNRHHCPIDSVKAFAQFFYPHELL